MEYSTNFIILCFFVTLYCSAIYSMHYGCPTNSEVINKLWPCGCSQTFEKTNWKTVVTCSGFNDYRKLKLSLNAIHGYRIDELLLYGINMPFLPDDVFVDEEDHDKVLVEIEAVSIQSSILQDIAEPINSQTNNHNRTFFTGLGYSMKQLRIESSYKVAQFSWDRLAQSLNIPRPSSQNPPLTDGKSLALKDLLFYNNEMLVLPESFDSMGNTSYNLNPERVILQWNGIKKIESSLIFPKMKILDLSWNQLESLGTLFKAKDKGIKDLTNIETVILKNNKLTNIKENNSIWDDFDNDKKRPKFLTYIDLRENLIECKCENMRWFAKSKLNGVVDGKCYSPPEVFGKPFDTCLPKYYYENETENKSDEV